MTVSSARTGPGSGGFSLRELLGLPLRGVAQVLLQENRLAGLLFLAGICANSILLGGATLLGAVVATFTARGLGADSTELKRGLHGFNGALVALALLVFLKPTLVGWVLVVVAVALATVLGAALSRLLRSWGLPGLTAPFVFVAWAAFLASARLGRLEPTQLLPTASLPGAAAVEGVVDVSTVLEGLVNGVAQVFFQQGMSAGLLICAGLAIASPRALAAALAGSLIGLGTAWLGGAAEPAIRAGLHGFNPALVAVALWAVFLPFNRASLVYGVLACVACALLFPALSAGLEPIGMPALTFPFVLTTWMFLLAAPAFSSLGQSSES